MSDNTPALAWAGGAVVATVLLAFAIRAGRRLRFLADTPTSKARGVFVGQVELSGRARIAQPVISYLAGAAAVWYRFEIEEEWEQWVTETSTNSKGETESHQVRRTGWRTVAEGGEAPPFFVEDDTGSVLVRPDKAQVEPVVTFDETVDRGQPLYFAKGPAAERADSTHRRRFRERAIACDATVFVAGRARERADAVAPEIAADKDAEMFLISCRAESKVQGGYRLQFWLLAILALLPLPAAGFFVSQATARPADVRLLAALATAVAGAELLAWLMMAFNSLVQLRNRVNQAWSLVDIQLKRRADLIPGMVAIVGGLRDHERRVQDEVAALRVQATATPPWEPGADVAGTKGAVQAVVERYPELKSDASFLRLQKELADTETRVALARDYYNEIATHHNTRLEVVPDRWLAPLAGLKPRPLLGAEGFERATPAVAITP